jgi:hypothetical protein
MNEGAFILSVIGLFLVVCVLFESFIITAFKITRFSRAVLHSFAINAASVGMVYLMWPIFRRMNFDEGKAFPVLPILVVSTIVIEALLLKALNLPQRWARIFLTSAVMNTVSFGILFLLLSLL